MIATTDKRTRAGTDWLLRSMYDSCVTGSPDPVVEDSLDMLALLAERMPRSSREISRRREPVTDVSVREGGYSVDLALDRAEVRIVYVGRRGAPRVTIERCKAEPADLERLLHRFLASLVRSRPGR